MHTKKFTRADWSEEIKQSKKKPPVSKITKRLISMVSNLTLEERQLLEFEEEKKSIPASEIEVAECLSCFIKYNPYLHHLDL